MHIIVQQKTKTQEFTVTSSTNVTKLLVMLASKLPNHVHMKACGINMNARILEFPTYQLQIKLSYDEGIVEVALPAGPFILKTEEDVTLFIDDVVSGTEDLLLPMEHELSPLPDDYLVSDLTVGQFKQLLGISRDIGYVLRAETQQDTDK